MDEPRDGSAAIEAPKELRADVAIARRFAMEEWDSPEEAIANVAVKLGASASLPEIARIVGRPVSEIEALRSKPEFLKLMMRQARVMAYTPEKAVMAEKALHHLGMEELFRRFADPEKMAGEKTTDITKTMLGASQATAQHLRNLETVRTVSKGYEDQAPRSHRELVERFFSSEEGIEYFRAQVEGGDPRALELLEEYEGRPIPPDEIATVMYKIAEGLAKKPEAPQS